MNLDSTLLQFDHDFSVLLASTSPTRAHTLIASADYIYLLAPSSYLGVMYTPILARRLVEQGKQVVLVDDHLAAQGDLWQEWPVLSADAFISQASGRSAALAVNMAASPFVQGYFSQIAARAQLPELDMIPVMDVLEA